jgi:hypothetical protein
MKLTFKHKITGRLIAVSTEGDSPDEPQKPTIVSDSEQVKVALLREINSSSGFYGHANNTEEITNLDLYAASKSLPSFEVISEEMVVTPPEPLPDGVLS